MGTKNWLDEEDNNYIPKEDTKKSVEEDTKKYSKKEFDKLDKVDKIVKLVKGLEKKPFNHKKIKKYFPFENKRPFDFNVIKFIMLIVPFGVIVVVGFTVFNNMQDILGQATQTSNTTSLGVIDSVFNNSTITTMGVLLTFGGLAIISYIVINFFRRDDII